MDQIKFKVIPKSKPFMFVLRDTIHVSYGYLWSTSDAHLQSAVNHELGHVDNIGTMLKLVTLTSVFFIFLSAAVSMSIVILSFFWLTFYFIMCYFCRAGEYFADYYSYNVNHEGVHELLLAEGKRMDRWWIDNTVLYLFRYHPSYKRRIKHLGLKTIQHLS